MNRYTNTCEVCILPVKVKGHPIYILPMFTWLIRKENVSSTAKKKKGEIINVLWLLLNGILGKNTIMFLKVRFWVLSMVL